jgi:hypothetical protein
MSFNYNAAGQDYIQVGIRKPPLGKGLIHEKALEMIGISHDLAIKEAGGVNTKGKPIEKLLCAYNRLEGIYIITRRLIKSLENIPNMVFNIPDDGPTMMHMPTSEIFLDFSSLIYHSASTLDILSQYYCQESGVNHKKFRGSKDKIYNTQPPDIRADNLWSDLQQFETNISNVFTEYDGFKGLRNIITHNDSVLGMSSLNFTIHKLNANALLCFDCEFEIERTNDGLKKYLSLTEIMNLVCSYIPWIVCKTSIHYLTRTKHGGIMYNEHSIPNWTAEKFLPIWNNPYVKFSDFLSDDKNDEVYSTLRVTYNGTQTYNVPLKREVLNHIIKGGRESKGSESIDMDKTDDQVQKKSRESSVRWQGRTIEQFGYALNVIFGLAIASIGYEASLILNDDIQFVGWQTCLLSISLLALVVSSCAAFWCIINRLRDFRLTAKISRKRENKENDIELEYLRKEAKGLGDFTWTLFWWQIWSFIIGVISLSIVVASFLR